MSYQLPFVSSKGDNEDNFDEVKENHVNSDNEAEKMVVVIVQQKGALNELRLVDVVAKREGSSLLDKRESALNSRWSHVETEVGIDLKVSANASQQSVLRQSSVSEELHPVYL